MANGGCVTGSAVRRQASSRSQAGDPPRQGRVDLRWDGVVDESASLLSAHVGLLSWIRRRSVPAVRWSTSATARGTRRSEGAADLMENAGNRRSKAHLPRRGLPRAAGLGQRRRCRERKQYPTTHSRRTCSAPAMTEQVFEGKVELVLLSTQHRRRGQDRSALQRPAQCGGTSRTTS